MINRFGAVTVLVFALAVFSTGSAPVHGQNPVRISNPAAVVICAPCPGEAFGQTGPGMVLMDPQNGGIFFYSLDRGQARTVGLATRAQEVITPRRIATITNIGFEMTWALQDGR